MSWTLPVVLRRGVVKAEGGLYMPPSLIRVLQNITHNKFGSVLFLLHTSPKIFRRGENTTLVH